MLRRSLQTRVRVGAAEAEEGAQAEVWEQYRSGGDDVEEFHCPEIEWDWDDGGKSVAEVHADSDVLPQPTVVRLEHLDRASVVAVGRGGRGGGEQVGHVRPL